MKAHGNQKLLPKFYGPYMVDNRVSSTAYKLYLPSSATIHDVIHISQLTLCPNPQGQPIQYLIVIVPKEKKVPLAIIDRKMVKRGRIAATKVLVQRKYLPLEKATWEFYYDLLKRFPDFNPRGHGCCEEEGIVIGFQ